MARTGRNPRETLRDSKVALVADLETRDATEPAATAATEPNQW